MCDPVTAVVATTAVLKIGSAVLEHKAQNKQADENEKSALSALKIQDHELSLEEVQQRIAGNQQRQAGDNEALSASGDVAASAASRGIGGASIDLLLDDITAQRTRYSDSVDQNTNAAIAQTDRQKEAARAEATARINGTPKASLAATTLKIAGAGLDAYTGLKIKSPKGV